MKTIKVACVLCVGAVLAFATGCGKSKALLAAEEYQKDACACKDAACIATASKKFADNAKDMATASSGEAEAITKATSAATECATKVATAGVPGVK